MLFKIILSYIIGYLRISIEGYYVERFINICRNQNIIIWNIKRKKGTIVYANIRLKDFKKIGEIARKINCKVNIVKKVGLPFFISKYKKRKIFVIMLIFVIVVICISSFYVWNVDIVVENNQNLDNIEKDIDEVGLKKGILKSKVNTKNVINNLRLKRNDIAWVGIEIKGTNAIVKIVKAREKPEIINQNEFCNIVATKAGIITKINAQNGTANVNVGDSVKGGDILINGWMEGKYTGIRYVHAIGEVEAKISYTKTKKIPYRAEISRKTGKKKNRYAIKLNNFKINLIKIYPKLQNYDTIETEKRIKIFSDFYLPVSIVKTTFEETEKYVQNYSVEEAKNIGIEELQKDLEKEIANKGNVVNKNINAYEKDDGVEVCITYDVLENIGTNEKIVF